MKTSSQFPFLPFSGSLSYRKTGLSGSLSCKSCGSLSTTIYYILGGRARYGYR